MKIRPSKMRSSSTGFKGVYTNGSGVNPYTATLDVKFNNKRTYVSLGRFKTAEAAQLARISFIDSLK